MTLTQVVIGKHLAMDQPTASRWLAQIEGWRDMSLDDLRSRYIRGLRSRLSGHESPSGANLVEARVRTERLQAELLELQLAEKRGETVQVAQIEPVLARAFVAFRQSLLNLGTDVAAELGSVYDVAIDPELIDVVVRRHLDELSRLNPLGDDDPAADVEPGDKPE